MKTDVIVNAFITFSFYLMNHDSPMLNSLFYQLPSKEVTLKLGRGYRSRQQKFPFVSLWTDVSIPILHTLLQFTYSSTIHKDSFLNMPASSVMSFLLAVQKAWLTIFPFLLPQLTILAVSHLSLSWTCTTFCSSHMELLYIVLQSCYIHPHIKLSLVVYCSLKMQSVSKLPLCSLLTSCSGMPNNAWRLTLFLLSCLLSHLLSGQILLISIL